MVLTALFVIIQSSVTPCHLIDKNKSFAGIFIPAAFLRLRCRRINKLEASKVCSTCSVFVVIFCRSLCNFSNVNERSKRNNVGNCGDKAEYSVYVT